MAGWFNTGGPRTYYTDFVLYPTVIMAVAALTLRSWSWPLWFAAGTAAWTLAEYWVHRSLLHGPLWHGAHELHHDNPMDFVELPPWYAAGSFAGSVAVAWLVLPGSAVWPASAGFMAGYCWFILMHHWLHHVELTGKPAALQSFAVWHNRHHKLTRMNYGVTTPLWDRVFGTSR